MLRVIMSTNRAIKMLQLDRMCEGDTGNTPGLPEVKWRADWERRVAKLRGPMRVWFSVVKFEEEASLGEAGKHSGKAAATYSPEWHTGKYRS